MPKSFILSYVDEKMLRGTANKEPGPLVTIARDYGCPGVSVATHARAALSAVGEEWQLIDREIIEQAAEQLGVSPEEAERISTGGPPGFFENLVGGFSNQQNKSDAAVKRRIASVIRAAALAGNVVILGRGGVVITRDIANSVHVKLYAPMDYRIERVKQMDQVATDREAIQKIHAVDRERVYLRDYFAGEILSPDIFDVQFNCARVSELEIVKTIAALAGEKFK
ncbi:MAG: cytidylate kinase-like family protein [Spirochaetia bacterium]|nr:cytidylate kinase-like family protein [Spirochaetia bacterium]